LVFNSFFKPTASEINKISFGIPGFFASILVIIAAGLNGVEE
jgi:hypothetical protein